MTGDSNIEYIFDDITIFDDTSRTNITLDTIDTIDSNKPTTSQLKKIQQVTKRKTNDDDEYLDIERKKLKLLEADIERANNEDEDLQFFKSLLPSIKKFPHLKKLQLKANILNQVIEITKEEELKNNLE